MVKCCSFLVCWLYPTTPWLRMTPTPVRSLRNIAQKCGRSSPFECDETFAVPKLRDGSACQLGGLETKYCKWWALHKVSPELQEFLRGNMLGIAWHWKASIFCGFAWLYHFRSIVAFTPCMAVDCRLLEPMHRGLGGMIMSQRVVHRDKG